MFIKDYYISGAIQMTGWAKKHDEESFDGEVTWFYKNGDREGTFKEFHENGNIIEIINYSKGYKNGEATRFYENGKIATLLNYENGKKNGNAVAYTPEGTVISDVVFKDNNPYDGVFIKGDKDLKTEANFKEGLITEIESKHNTIIITKGTFADGKPNNGTFISPYYKKYIASKSITYAADLKKQQLLLMVKKKVNRL